MKTELRETLDGSHTLYLEALDEHYHSTFGAIQESSHVFIQSGFDVLDLKEIRVLEIGFGTGLNCLLTLLRGLKKSGKIFYHAIEKYPLQKEIWEQLNFSRQFEVGSSHFFADLHQAKWNSEVEIHPEFYLTKKSEDFILLEADQLPMVDLVYFDAFSPEKQPELWDISIFEKIFKRMNFRGILVTYCAKGVVRRNLQSVGFCVERLPGPPGKREMIRAIKK
jgi:tRNA U34 5-methylaminomethyl-2-thiouridine-forming methyltransferase MnmC